jgi:hypothetical protein
MWSQTTLYKYYTTIVKVKVNRIKSKSQKNFDGLLNPNLAIKKALKSFTKERAIRAYSLSVLIQFSYG